LPRLLDRLQRAAAAAPDDAMLDVTTMQRLEE